MLKPSLGNKNTGLIKVLLADDHSIVREGLRALLESEKDIEVIGEAETGRDVLILAVKLKPDIILMDIAMPLLNGMEATRQLKTLAPNSKVLVLSAHSDAAYVEKMLGLGIRGYLIKQNSFKILATAIREVNMGNMYFSPTIATHFQNQDWKTILPKNAPLKNLAPLSSREMEVLQLVAEGNANKKIASLLTLSIKTVEKHRQHLMSKLNIHDTAGLTRYAISSGIIENIVHPTIRVNPATI